MSDSFTLTTYVPASPLQVYTAWLDGEQHSEMTGGRAHCEPVVGAAFDAWDGYIRGTNLELEPGRRILQSWRSSEFPDDAPDSRVELTLQPDADGTTILLRHWDIPPGQGGNYEKGWHEHYFSPMRQYFDKQTNTQVISADRPAPAQQEWERPGGDDDVDDWSSDSSSDAHDVGWEAPVIEEVDEPEQPAQPPAPEEDEKPQPITLQAERPFLDAPQPKAQDEPAPKPKKKAARKKPAAKKAAKKPAKKKAASKKKPAKKAAKKTAKKKPAKKAAKKATKKKPAKKKAAKKKPAKKAAKKGAKKKPAKKAAKKTAKKKSATKKKPARKAAKKKAGKKAAKKGGKKAAKKPARKKATRKRR